MELSGFISSYSPYYKNDSKTLQRYQIVDAYLQFYYKFIRPIERKVDEGSFRRDPTLALNKSEYSTWLGFQFERWCRANHILIAELLGFKSVKYKHGSFFSRKSSLMEPGFQWDLVFDRKDRVMTLCEVKYLKSEVDINIINEFESKIALFPQEKLKGYAIEKVLIAAQGANEKLRSAGYFDKIISLEDIVMTL